MAAPLTLFGETLWISPYVCSSFVALTEKGVPFTVEELALGRGDQRAERYATPSLTAKVPALRHGDFWLAESNDHDVPEPVLRYARTQWCRPSLQAYVGHARPAAVPEEYWAFSGLRPPTPRRVR